MYEKPEVLIYLELSALQLKQLFSIYVLGSEFWDMVLQVEAHEPAGHLLGGPLWYAAVLPLMLLQKLSLVQDLNIYNGGRETDVDREK